MPFGRNCEKNLATAERVNRVASMKQDKHAIPDDKRASIEQVIKMMQSPSDAGIACGMGVMSWQEGNYEEACTYYRRGIELQPNPPLFMNMAVCLDDWGKRDEAVVALHQMYTSATSAEAKQIESMLSKNGKSALVKIAKKGKSPGPKKPGSRVAFWAEKFVGCRINDTILADWKNDKLQQLKANVDKTSVWQLRDDPDERERFVFLYVTMDESAIISIRYDVIHTTPMLERILLPCDASIGQQAVALKILEEISIS